MALRCSKIISRCATVQRPCSDFTDMLRRLTNCCIIIIIFLPSVSRIPRGLEKIKENCRSDHYCGQSSNTNESCSSTPLNRGTSTETRWNKKVLSLVAGMMTIFLTRSEKNQADSLIGPRVSTAVG